MPKLIANETIHLSPKEGDVAAKGAEFEVDADEAKRLVKIGAATRPAKAEKPADAAPKEPPKEPKP